MQSIPTGQKLFAKLDTVHGYFQLGLDEECSHATTFLLPQGLLCRHSDVMIVGLPWAMKIVDTSSSGLPM